MSTKLSEPAVALALIALALSCATLLLWLPRGVAPHELPELSLSRIEVEAVLRSDAARAHSASNDPHSQELDRLFLIQGEAETRGVEDLDSYRNRRKQLELGFAVLRHELGGDVAMRMRERAVERLDAALSIKLRDKQAKAVLGAFPNVLQHEGASRKGRLLAPRFVVRTLYKARWNLLYGLKPDFGFQRVERCAFYGWKALHGAGLNAPERIEALHSYGEAGGSDLEESLGILLYQAGDFEQSATALAAAYQKTGSLRLRNFLLAAREASAHD